MYICISYWISSLEADEAFVTLPVSGKRNVFKVILYMNKHFSYFDQKKWTLGLRALLLNHSVHQFSRESISLYTYLPTCIDSQINLNDYLWTCDNTFSYLMKFSFAHSKFCPVLIILKEFHLSFSLKCFCVSISFSYLNVTYYRVVLNYKIGC